LVEDLWMFFSFLQLPMIMSEHFLCAQGTNSSSSSSDDDDDDDDSHLP
jgi:hypothetical protein